MPRKIIMTSDGSPSVEWEEGVTYHSMHGAIQESMHIFIQAGLRERAALQEADNRSPLRIFELGLGTGLNALLSLREATASRRPVIYEAIEAFPLENDLIAPLDYSIQLGDPALQPLFTQLHACDWERPVEMTPYFTFLKSRDLWPGYTLRQPAGLVYYDAFDPVVQPELWTANAFESLYGQLTPGARLVTYCSKGAVRRSLEAVGFLVDKIPGPPGKREMIRARVPVPQAKE